MNEVFHQVYKPQIVKKHLVVDHIDRVRVKAHVGSVVSILERVVVDNNLDHLHRGATHVHISQMLAGESI